MPNKVPKQTNKDQKYVTSLSICPKNNNPDLYVTFWLACF